MLKKLLLSLILASTVQGKVVTVGTGKQFISVNYAVRGSVPLKEDLYVLVEMPTGSISGSDGVDPAIIGGFNGYKVIIRGFKHIPVATAYVEDESVLDWDGASYQESYVNIKGKEGVEGRTDFHTTLYYAKDHLGSTRMAVTVDNHSPQEINAYYSYGNLRNIQSTSVPIRDKFTGKELDTELGFFYFGARYYNADLGIWISPDPLRQYSSSYTYSGNNPGNIIDHDGRAGFFAAKGGDAKIGTGLSGYGCTGQEGTGYFAGGGNLSMGSFSLSTGFTGPGNGNYTLGASAGLGWTAGLTTANSAEDFAGISRSFGLEAGFLGDLSIQIGYGGKTGDFSLSVSAGVGGGLAATQWNTEKSVGKTTWSSVEAPSRLLNYISNNAADASSVAIKNP